MSAIIQTVIDNFCEDAITIMSTARVSSVFLPGDTGLLCDGQTAQ